MSKAIYAFSGDPITYGHIDIIKRALKIFDKVIVAIGVNPDKSYMFTLEERLDMAKKSLSKFKNVQVAAFKGLLVDFAYEQNADVIIRGIRNSEDFEYERMFYQASESQKLGIEMCPLFAKQELTHISSSMVKSLQKEQGLIHEYVPLYVKGCLEAKMSGQYIVGVTGEIGAGKSYISDMMQAIGKKKGIEVHHIELDHIWHKVLSEFKEEKYRKIREQIINIFGKEIANDDGSINRKALGEIVFNDEKKLEKLNELRYTPVTVKLRRELHDKTGIILVNAALLVEAGMTYISNNNMIMINVNKDVQEKRLKQRGYGEEQINHRIHCQYDFNKKLLRMKELIKEEGYGHIWNIDNSNEITVKQIEKLLMDVKEYFE